MTEWFTSAAQLSEPMLRLLEQHTPKGLPESACWPWQGSVDEDGYGRIRCKVGGTKRKISAHRAAFLVEHGSIELGLVVDHRCEQRDCVNPRHGEAVTIRENTKRRRLHRTQTGCGNGHGAHERRSDGRCKACARESTARRRREGRQLT